MPSILAVSEPVAAKRALARSLGADLVIDPATERIEELILMYSDGQGFDAVIDAAGELSAIENAVGLLARGGTLMLFSNYKANDLLKLSLMELYWKEVTILTSFGIDTSNYTADSANILRHLNIACLIDQILPLDEFQHAMQLYGSRQCLRILFENLTAKNSTSHFSRSVPARRRTSMLFVPAAFFALFSKNVFLILVILALAFL